MKEICNGKFIEQEHFSLNSKETNKILEAIKKNIPVQSVSKVYTKDDEWALGTATIFQVPIDFVDTVGRNRYNDRVKFSTIAPEIQIIVADTVGWKSENDHTEQHQFCSLVIFPGCKVCKFRHRIFREYSNKYHYGYKFKIEDLLTCDILPCLRTFAEDFKQIISPINSDIITT